MFALSRLRDQILRLARQLDVDLVMVEDTSSGMGIQLLREKPKLNVIGRHPKDDKQARLSRHQGRFEAGRIVLPVEAPWLADFENELLAFPSGRYDDQVDALLLSLGLPSMRTPSQSFLLPRFLSRVPRWVFRR